MSSDFDSTSPAEPAGYRIVGLPAQVSEHVVTGVAIGLALLIVALVAVLMGMA